MSSEIISMVVSLACDNYDGFQHLGFHILHKILFQIISKGLFNVEIVPRV